MQYIHKLPSDIKRTIYKLTLERMRFEKHQKYFRIIHEELKKNEFEDIVHLRCDELSIRNIKNIAFQELSDDIQDMMYVTNLMFYLETTSTMIRKNGKRYNIIGNLDQPVHCDKCNMATDALVNHRKRKLECKHCKLNEQ